PTRVMEEPTFYVNKKQFHRIVKRRAYRKRFGLPAQRERSKSYVHESRHKHAISRPRGPKGRFLEAEEF
ncbi:CCAAT-binding transcription factor, subunit B, partial [Parathielavia appendiculata]